MTTIKSIKAIQVLDSRGLPTVSCNIVLDNDIKALAMVPSGASTGTKEALELRDGDGPYMGKGVEKAVYNINNILSPSLIGLDPRNQKLIDQKLIELDGTDDKSNLGANALLAVSLAISHVAAKDKKISLHSHFSDIYLDITGDTISTNLPMPMLNILNGGEHADNNIDIQEFMIMPLGASSFSEGMQWSTEIYAGLKKLLQQQNLITGVGDEGGFAPNLKSHQEAIELIIQAIENNNLTPGADVSIALDCAATEFYDDCLYHLKGESLKLNAHEFSEYLESLSSKYPIVSIEDGMDESDNEGWKILTNALGKKCQLVGDDLFVTNVEELQRGIDGSLGNSILIKFNQIGTITETMRTIHLANLNNYTSVISHRSGETEDSMIADLCVGLGTGQIKTGAPCRSDRVAKYNRLLWIEAQNPNLTFAKNVFN